MPVDNSFGSSASLFGTFMIIGVIAAILCIILYILSGITYYRIGKNAGLDWAWVAWIPGGSTFVLAKVVNWDFWALFPILSFGVAVVAWIPFIGELASLAVAVFLIMQTAQLIMGYGRSALILLWNLVPFVGSIIYYILMYKMSSGTPQTFVSRTWYGIKHPSAPQDSSISV